MRFEKIWTQQCRATKGIKRAFGAKSALDYLIGEKLVTFADVAEKDPEFAAELPRFLSADAVDRLQQMLAAVATQSGVQVEVREYIAA